jgi:TP901 family phage tail tape measure protein
MAKIDIAIRVKDFFSSKFKSMMKNLKESRARFRVWARRVSGAVAVVAGAFARGLMKFNEFNKGMARIEAVASGGKLDAGLRRLARELSEKTGRDVKETMEGIYQAMSAGVPRDNIFEFMRTAARAAVVDGSAMATSVDGLTSILNAFGMEYSQAGEVAIKMQKTVNNGKTTMEELGGSLSKVTSFAATMGVSIDDVLAAVATLTSKGDTTSEAVTQISAAILAVNQELGDGAFATHGFIKSLQIMREKADGSANKLKEMTGRKEGMNAILKLTDENMSKFIGTMDDLTSSADPLSDAIEGSTGDALELDQAWQGVQSVWRELGSVANSLLGPGLKKLAELLKSAAEGMRMARKDSGMMKLAFQEMKLTLIDFNLKLLGMQRFLAVGPMEKFYQTQINSLEKQKKELKSTMELENKNRQASLAHENELKRIAREKEKQKEADKQAELDKRAEAVKTEAQEIASAIKATEAQEEQWAKESEARDKFYEEQGDAEDKALEEAKKKRERMMKEEFERRKKMREDDLRDQLAKAKEAAKIPDPLRGMAGFAQGFAGFRERMKQRKEGFADTKEVAKRFERLKDKHARGIKISREDREWLKALGAFNRERKAQEAAKKKAELIQEQIKTLLEKNLQGADNGR